MSFFWREWREANQKPPYGSVLNPDSSRARRLVMQNVFNEGVGLPSGGSVNLAQWLPRGLQYTAASSQYTRLLPGNSVFPSGTTDATIIIDVQRTLNANDGTVIWLSNNNDMRSYLNVWKSGSEEFRYWYRDSSNNWSSITSAASALQPHTVAITMSGTTITLYIDGAQVNQKSDYDASHSLGRLSATPIQLGAYGTGSAYFNGVISRVLCYTRALSASEVATDKIEPYGTDLYLVPSAARVFDIIQSGTIAARTALAWVAGFQSSASRQGAGVRESDSSIQPVTQLVDRFGQALRSSDSLVQPVVAESNRAGSGTRESETSTVGGIAAESNRSGTGVRSDTSTVGSVTSESSRAGQAVRTSEAYTAPVMSLSSRFGTAVRSALTWVRRLWAYATCQRPSTTQRVKSPTTAEIMVVTTTAAVMAATTSAELALSTTTAEIT